MTSTFMSCRFLSVFVDLPLPFLSDIRLKILLRHAEHFLELSITRDTFAVYRLISPKYFIPLITLTWKTRRLRDAEPTGLSKMRLAFCLFNV